MNRAVWTLFVAAALAAAARAGATELRGGAWGGPNISTLRIDGLADDERERRTAPGLGGVLAWRPSASWSVEVRPSYVGRGATVRIAGSPVDVEASLIEFPLLLTRELGAGRARPYLMAGTAVARLTSAKAVFASSEQDIVDDFERTTWSLRAGAGVRWRRGAADPFLEVEYTRGLTDLNARRRGLGGAVGAIRDRGVQVRVGVSFGVGNE